MYFLKKDIQSLESTYRINIINSITGIKPANLIGTIAKNNITNLAIFSSVVHIGSNPALIGMFSRPVEKVVRNTLTNILSTKMYTINHVHEKYYKNAHKTSVKYSQEESEFDKCNFNEEYLYNFKVPFVKESNIKIGMKYIDHIDINLNNTVLIIGEVQNITIDDSIVSDNGYLNLENAKSVGISGCNSYYSLKKINDLEYVENKNNK
mgnify:FL=1